MAIENITKQHVLDAVEKIEREKIALAPSTTYDVIINGKAYPPKEVMRYANLLANGKKEWLYSGGEPTNKYLRAFEFNVISKNEEAEKNASKESFIQLLQRMGKSAAEQFFKGAADLMYTLNVKEGDDRLTYGTRGSKRLSITIGQRYCYAYIPEVEKKWQFIHDTNKESSEDIEVTEYESEPEAYYYLCSSVDVIAKEFDGILKASIKELERTTVSGFRKFNDSVFEKAVLDTTFRKQLFDKAFGNSVPVFFTKDDFEELQRFSMQSKDPGNAAHQKTYDLLKNIYAKTSYWAHETQRELFYDGEVQIIQKPTNQANKFEAYHWAKIYPNKQAALFKQLAYTVGINTENYFTIKIDTVGLGEQHEKRKLYLNERGDYKNSLIVKQLPADKILDKDWKYLIDVSVKLIQGMQQQFDSIFQLLGGISDLKNSNKNFTMALNTILYGPPGTGKTYKLQSLFPSFTQQQAVQTRENYITGLIDELTWWETVTASMMELEKVTVPALEAHEYLKIKSQLSDTKNVKQIIWGSLQAHTDPSSTTVKTSNRTEPYIFDKLENSVWIVHKDKVEQNCPEVNEFLNKVRNFQPTSKADIRNYRMVTFHQSFAYEDFVEGIKPVMNGEGEKELGYEVAKGIFYKACNEAVRLAGYEDLSACLADNKENRKQKLSNAQPYALFIDEINRANVSAVLGELITLIEEDKRLGMENEIIDIYLPYSKKPFGVPANLYIIGTMNTADRSVEALDTALRRRFVFEEMNPNSKYLHPKELLCNFWNKKEFLNLNDDDWQKEPFKTETDNFYELIGLTRNEEDKIFSVQYNEDRLNWIVDDLNDFTDEIFTGIRLDLLLETINRRLEVLLSKDHTIGHAFFINVCSIEDLQKVFKHKILPLLQEFFYNDYAKIGLVLGNEFLETQTTGTKLFAGFKEAADLAADYSDKVTYHLKDPMLIDSKGFQSVYHSGR